MTPGFCFSTAAGREYLHRVNEYAARRAHVEEMYGNAVNQRENERLRTGRIGPVALKEFGVRERPKMSLLENQYNSRNAQYNEALRLLHMEYDNAVLAVHYEPLLGSVLWWRPLGREHRVFRRMTESDRDNVRELMKERGR